MKTNTMLNDTNHYKMNAMLKNTLLKVNTMLKNTKFKIDTILEKMNTMLEKNEYNV